MSVKDDLLYNQIGETARAFWDWRHKVISMYFLVFGGFFVFAAWIYDHSFSSFFPILFILWGLTNVVFALMDSINIRILNYCYVEGKKYESQGTSHMQGIFTSISNYNTGNVNVFSSKLSYTKILKIIYWGTAIISFVLAIILFFCPLPIHLPSK